MPVAELGHEEWFPLTRLSAYCGFRKETIAGTQSNERDAPIPDPPAVTPGHEGSTSRRPIGARWIRGPLLHSDHLSSQIVAKSWLR